MNSFEKLVKWLEMEERECPEKWFKEGLDKLKCDQELLRVANEVIQDRNKRIDELRQTLLMKQMNLLMGYYSSYRDRNEAAMKMLEEEGVI